MDNTARGNFIVLHVQCIYISVGIVYITYDIGEEAKEAEQAATGEDPAPHTAQWCYCG